MISCRVDTGKEKIPNQRNGGEISPINLDRGVTCNTIGVDLFIMHDKKQDMSFQEWRSFFGKPFCLYLSLENKNVSHPSQEL